MKILEITETDCDFMTDADLEPALMKEIPPIMLADLSGYSDGNNSGFCPNYPLFSKDAGGEVVLDCCLVDPRRPEWSRRRLVSTTLHEISHRLTRDEVFSGQAHGAVFAAVCFALTSRCLGLDVANGSLRLYDVSDAKDKSMAFGFAVDFGTRNSISQVPAEDLPGLARVEWNSLVCASEANRQALESAIDRAERAKTEAETERSIAKFEAGLSRSYSLRVKELEKKLGSYASAAKSAAKVLSFFGFLSFLYFFV